MGKIPVHFSIEASVFHGRTLPEPGHVVGYGAIIAAMGLAMPMPTVISIISRKRRQYIREGWNVLTPKHQPEESLYKQLVFALKYEGVDLLCFKKLFGKLSAAQVKELLAIEPSGQYSRKIWFLYEWLLAKKLGIPDADVKIKYVPLLDAKIQYAIVGTPSARHRITNNLPGTPAFCPLIRSTTALEAHLAVEQARRSQHVMGGVHADVMQRASAFLLLKDSKASFTIEGESPKSKRAARWGQAIGQAGLNPLSKDELLRLQQLVIESDRFTPMGYRHKGGFVGEHDRSSGEPIPDHISARWTDVDDLMAGVLAANERLQGPEFDAVLAATMIAFGFVFIHPFVDGNGRLHRYLIHHVLARKKFGAQGVIFPISAAILDHINDYRQVLEAYSHPLLDHIEWSATADNNVDVRNNTADFYRYFDVTPQAEFLYAMVQDTIERIIPEEVDYLQRYDRMKRFLDDTYEMPDKTVDLLIQFLRQGDGTLSARARSKEFAALKDKEITRIEKEFASIFKGA
ncbi:MAG: Fic family protein [Flavobacteriales bacterium]